MSYDYAALAAHVKDAVEANPSVNLKSICHERQVDRHTINRALLSCLGIRFSELKALIRRQQIQKALTDSRAKSIKQAAADAGYGSSSALGKQTRKAFQLPPTSVRRKARP